MIYSAVLVHVNDWALVPTVDVGADGGRELFDVVEGVAADRLPW